MTFDIQQYMNNRAKQRQIFIGVSPNIDFYIVSRNVLKNQTVMKEYIFQKWQNT